MSNSNTKYMLATLGLLLLGLSFALYHYADEVTNFISPPQSSAVHVHSDFALYVLGNRVNLTAEKYQSSVESVKHPDMHFHDGVDTMIHRHADGITLGAFMDSLGFTLTDSCIVFDTGESYCSDASNALLLFINGQKMSNIASYVPKEEDRILLYYGNPESPDIASLQRGVTDEACIYSGTCPERGEPPFESCGITCEI